MIHLVNPFTPESDQCQNSPAASQEIWHHAVWGTWLFIAYSDEKWLCTTNSRYITHTIAFWKVGRIHFLSSGVKGSSVLSYCEWSSEALIPCTSRGYYIFPLPPTLPLAEKLCLQCYRSMLIFYRSFPLQINWLRFTDVHLTPYRRENWKSPIVWHKCKSPCCSMTSLALRKESFFVAVKYNWATRTQCINAWN